MKKPTPHPSNIILGALAVFALIMAMFVYLYTPATAAQPGDAADPLVTRSFVEREIAALEIEIEQLRAVVAGVIPGTFPSTQQLTEGGNLTQADRDVFLAEVMLYFEMVYGTRLDSLEAAIANAGIPGPGDAPSEIPVFRSITMQAGQSIIFEAGAEFILRGGHATIIAPDPEIGIPDVTAGRDVTNGTRVSDHHLHVVPRTDGRGIRFHGRSWVMVRGGHTIVN